jgi:peptidoglycan/xylan/chitin deacetylase (PgdA/CDA1 family)
MPLSDKRRKGECNSPLQHPAERFGIDSESNRFAFGSPGECIGGAAFALAFLLALADPRLATVPLAGFAILSLAAPFSTRFGYFMPAVRRGNSGKRAVALTFDDGPDPETTPLLLDLLERRGVRAAFFVTGKRAESHPDLIREILNRGHEIGNHTYRHDNLIMLRPARVLRREIRRTQQILAQFGVAPLAFRPPVGIISPRLPQILNGSDMFPALFSRRAGDAGNRRVKGIARRLLRGVRPDDILLLHDIRPPNPSLTRDWILEVESLLNGLERRGITILPLSELIGRRVTASVDLSEGRD